MSSTATGKSFSTTLCTNVHDTGEKRGRKDQVAGWIRFCGCVAAVACSAAEADGRVQTGNRRLHDMMEDTTPPGTDSRARLLQDEDNAYFKIHQINTRIFPTSRLHFKTASDENS